MRLSWFKHKWLFQLLIVLVIILISSMGVKAENSEAILDIYELSSCYEASEQASMRINGYDAPIIKYMPTYDYAHFSFSGEIDITITVNEPINTYSISPISKDIRGEVDGNSLSFTISKSEYLIVKINSLRDIVIAADDIEADMPMPNGKGIYNITGAPYNADNTGKKLVTEALQGAIDDANEAGGGIVYVPIGIYLTGNIEMKSNVWLYLEGGAILRSTGNPDDYTVHFKKSNNGVKRKGTWFVYADKAENIRIYGRGTIDARGDYMFNERDFTSVALIFQQCRGIIIDGIILRDSGFWNTLMLRSDNIELLNTKHLNKVRNDYGENDAVDIVECQNVLVKHSIGISEDDSYSTKCYSNWGIEELNWGGKEEYIDNITFDDCLAWSSCGTFKVGFGFANAQKNITFKNSCSYKSMYALSIQNTWGSGPAENIIFDNISIEGFDPRPGSKARWFEFNIRGNGSCSISNVLVKNINIYSFGDVSSSLTGLNPDKSFNNITFIKILIPGKNAPAETLEEMNILNARYYNNLTILPQLDIDYIPEGHSYDYTDKSTGIRIRAMSGVLPYKTLPWIFMPKKGDRYKSALNSVKKGKAFEVYDIALRYDGRYVSPDGEMIIHIPLASYKKDCIYKIFNVQDDGTAVNMNGTVSEEGIAITTGKCGLYVITEADFTDPGDDTEPEPGETDNNEPDTSETDNYEPDPGEPDINEPDVSEPDMSEPDGPASPPTGDKFITYILPILFVLFCVILFLLAGYPVKQSR